MRSARGFTLVELLVALAIMAILAMLSWRGLDGMTRAYEQTQRRADEVLALQTGLAQWSADLDALVQLDKLGGIEWNGRVLRLTRRGTASVVDGIHVVAWTHREGQWLRWETPGLVTRGDIERAWTEADLWARNPSDEQRRYEVAIGPLAQWEIFYFRGDAWTNPQSSDVAGPGTIVPAARFGQLAPPVAAARIASIPDGVRLVIDLPEGRALAGRITRDWVNPTVGGGKS